ncbi:MULTISPECIES: N-acetylglucosamine-specific PTS transporter subunit IIBC [Fusobacterium]|jgi:PTS system N-acetylglucosamine-specific IIC component|uniref:PTS glucose transporter subunit IIBC n=1 Tax=Fusobacterium varium ATCC 27725 TaxID=469618 RepID=A0ABN5JKZ0_FUSVA|nr:MULTISPECIES: N-acetylglucosamine-specific PTS transporter subunit IIBC [Fusobacterium]AVQ31831.1 PTS glucose transporter subunit IIBC [Fusobacterium varium ATCC 27725]EES63186.1 PTS system, N-acetylglucosamine-specific IIBC component [Fusobacterium varium ATCC 27725]MCF0171513.1 PTS transporter subunit EIIC [Fusobacterium varium]MCF2672325.1 PTS transporter subunit EIIBC [Fusobacterium varium]UYI77311.1 MAG: N-acetylglucosamine-specific PTS transporter subunit IIBC [Fusobacterium varium]
MFSYLQKIGKALMVPVAVLPAAAILLGLGYWIDPVGWGGESVLAAFFIKSGGAIIDNMPILFAIGVAFGMSKDKNGSAALAGLVSFLVVTTLLSPGAVGMIKGIPANEVPAGFAKINNQFTGILCGVISSALYNKFSEVELPKFLSFFSGKRLVPIISSFVMMLVSFILMYIWPAVYSGLVTFGEGISKLGPVGAGIYGFFNRLLIPVGLHHALNSVFWFDVAGINDIPNFLGGAKSIAEGTAVIGKTGMYQAGFFPIMMFGLLGACLAFVRTAKPQNRAKISSIMLAAGFASFFTGVTEPIEFAFMFVAPGLYLVHAILTGISVFIAASMHWMAGFGFSAGFIDLVLSTRNPLAQGWYMLVVQGLVFFVIYYVIFKFAIEKFNLKTPGREDDDDTVEEKGASKVTSNTELAAALLPLLGGKSNIVNIDNCTTRLRLDVVDSSVVKEGEIKKLVPGVLKPSKTAVQVIVGPEVEFVATELKKLV